MMRIHGALYLLVGVILIVFSYYIVIAQNRELNKFAFFILIGAVFMIIGLGKLIIAKASSKQKEVSKDIHSSGNVQHEANNVHESLVKFCNKCGASLRHFDKFCYKCGNRNFHPKFRKL